MQRMFVSTAAGEWSTTQSPNLLDDLYTGEVWDGRIEYKLVIFVCIRVKLREFINRRVNNVESDVNVDSAATRVCRVVHL